MENDQNTPKETPIEPPVETTSFTPTTGMAQIQNAVEFIEAQVLQPEVDPIASSAKAMANQAAAMMVQDVASFVKGNEQVITVGIAQAIAMIMSQEKPKQEAGAAALAALETVMTKLPTFAQSIGKTAGGIISDFSS